MVLQRSGILDMFVLYINDNVANCCESDDLRFANTATLLTCETYLVFDDRSVTERSRVGTEKIVAMLKERAFQECDEYIEQLSAQKDRKSLELLYNKLTDNACRKKISRILQKREVKNDSTIEI